MEVWKDVIGFEGLYQVSNLGKVQSFLQNKKILRPSTTSKGYRHVVLRKDGKSTTYRVSRLVALAFIPNPENKAEINHKNGDKNDNSVDNLEWCTRSENLQHAIATGLKGYNLKKVAQYTLSNKLIAIFKDSREAKERTSLDRKMINKACRGGRKSYAGYKWAYL